MTETPPAPPPPVARDPAPLSRAGFLGWALGFVLLIALSVIGLGHSPQIRGAANIEFWMVVLAVAAAATAVTVALARTPAATSGGRIGRSVVAAFAGVAIALFVWDAITLGLNAGPAPSDAAMAAIRAF